MTVRSRLQLDVLARYPEIKNLAGIAMSNMI